MCAAPALSPISARTRLKMRRTWAGLAMPVVSDKPDSSAPASMTAPASQTTSSSATAPWRVQPKAVEMPASIFTWGAMSRRRASMRRTSSTISSRVLRTLASECAALAETGKVILCTPAFNAASAPRRFGTSAITVRPGSVRAWRTTSVASAIWGSSLGGTKEATSISRMPLAYRASIQESLAGVGMVALTDCRPSRGPTSLIKTWGLDDMVNGLHTA